MTDTMSLLKEELSKQSDLKFRVIQATDSTYAIVEDDGDNSVKSRIYVGMYLRGVDPSDYQKYIANALATYEKEKLGVAA